MENVEQKKSAMERLDAFIEKRYIWLFWSITSLALIMWFVPAFSKAYYIDDLYTLNIIKQSFGGIWKSTALDVHPPMYYWMLKIFTAVFKNKQFWGHVFSIIPFYLVITVGANEIKKLFSKKIAILFIIAFVCFPFSLQQSLSIRMYSWCLLYITFSAIYAFKIYKENKIKDWLIFAGLGLMSAYTQYFSFVSTIVIYLILFTAILINEDKRKKMWWIWVVCVIGSLALYAPWMVNFIAQMKVKVTQEYHIQPMSVRRIFQFFYQFFKSGPKAYGIDSFELLDFSTFLTLLNILAYLTMFIFLILDYKKDKNNVITSAFAVTVPFATALVGILASIIIRPVFEIRYVIPCIPLFCFAGVYGLSKIKNIWIFSIIPIFLIANIGIFYGVLLKEKMTVSENYISQEVIDSLPERDVVVVELKEPQDYNTGLQTVGTEAFLLFMDDVMYIDPSRFFDNYQDYSSGLRDLSTFDYTSNKVLLITNRGREVETKYLEKYNAEFVRQIDASEILVDVYILTLK